MLHVQASDVAPDAFSYLMALKACSAGLWSADSWIEGTGWRPEEEEGSPLICEYEELYVDHGATAASCRGRNAIEVGKTVARCLSHACIRAVRVWNELSHPIDGLLTWPAVDCLGPMLSVCHRANVEQPVWNHKHLFRQRRLIRPGARAGFSGLCKRTHGRGRSL